MGGGIVALWIIILIARSVSSGSEQKGKPIPAESGLSVMALVVWMVCFILLLPTLAEGDWTLRLVIWPLVILFLLPSQVARLTIRLGLVRTSYCLGRLALYANRRSQLAGALFYGWRALQRHPRDSRRYARGLDFLQWRLQRPKVFSGGIMLMQLLMRMDDLDEERRYARLRLMKHLDFETIPRALARHAFDVLAAHALARGDWAEIRASGDTWRRACYVPLAGLLVTHHKRARGEKRFADIGLRYLYWLGSGRPKWLDQLPPVPLDTAETAAAPAAPSHDALLAQAAARVRHGQALAPLQADWLASLRSPGFAATWTSRAAALGCRDTTGAVEAVRASVRSCLAHGDTSVLDDDAQAQALDLQFEKLRFLTRAITRRQESQQLMPGNLEFEEFLNFCELLHSFTGSQTVRYQAYAIAEHAVWNWMADLWNLRLERGLAYFMCGAMIVPASEFGSEAARVYNQILRREIR